MPHNEMQILAVIHRILVNDLGRIVDLSPSLLEQTFQQDLSLDSLEMVTLQIAIEDAFNVYFDPIHEDLPLIFATVRNLVDYLQRDH